MKTKAPLNTAQLGLRSCRSLRAYLLSGLLTAALFGLHVIASPTADQGPLTLASIVAFVAHMGMGLRYLSMKASSLPIPKRLTNRARNVMNSVCPSYIDALTAQRRRLLIHDLFAVMSITVARQA